MAMKNATTENRPTATENGGQGAAGVTGGARPSGAAGAVWDALTANPGATVTAIATGAGVSKTLAARTLAKLEGEGRAARTRGGRDGGRRLPDIWTAVTPDAETRTDADADASAETADLDEPAAAPAVPTTDAPAEEAPAVPDGNVTDAADRSDGTDTDTGETELEVIDETAANEAREALWAMGKAVTAALEALDAGDPEAALTAAERVYSGSGKARRLVRAAAVGRPRTGSGRPRSAPGEMRAKVAGHLATHPGMEFTPHEIAKVIGHSAGAVSNALDRLAEAGEAALVCERPRRFTGTAR
ncbi:hypothetical protein [Actinomadura sp. WAC 06369]|uniref:hypothetical protein n=1 Tax=Actinomadura sp. WAC 06369 TaxID=2203193 RepID=UPI000F78C42E|nr:hypothetical protein [Actinomadura sp. WAC 06369]RSN56610.1 hypothetical protein DMH08_25155 [Actinomadura sp. WAC 06369]